MKKTFTKEYILANCGCYKEEGGLQALCLNAEYTALEILNYEDIPLEDRLWFLAYNSPQTNNERVLFAYVCAKSAAHLNKDEDMQVSLDLLKKWLEDEGSVSVEELEDAAFEAYCAEVKVHAAYASNFYGAAYYPAAEATTCAYRAIIEYYDRDARTKDYAAHWAACAARAAIEAVQHDDYIIACRAAAAAAKAAWEAEDYYSPAADNPIEKYYSPAAEQQLIAAIAEILK